MKGKENRNYSVIAKGEYAYKQTNAFLPIERFLIIRKKSRRFLLLNFDNRRNETLTGLTLQIDQFDAHGNPLGVADKQLSDLAFKKGKFILKDSIELHRSCIDCRVKVIRAEYGNFAYCLGADDVYATYEKRKKKQPIDKEAIVKEVGEEGVLVKRRRFGFPVAVGVISGVLIVGAAIASFVHLNNFKEDESSFFLNNIEYAFVDDEDRSADAPVNIVGYVGLGGDSIVIPNSVDGHPVYQIQDAAFMYNDILEEVVIEGGVRIGSNAFRGCRNLEKVVIEDNVTIESYAFAECSSLQEFSANNLEEIGLGAFNYCNALASVRLTGDTYSVLQLDAQVFANCSALTDVYIDQYVNYENGGRYFYNNKNIENLYLKNYNYSQYEDGTEKALSDLLGDNAKVKNVTIHYMDGLPASFAGSCGSALETFTVKNFSGTAMGDSAFADCKKLTKVSVSGSLTIIGDEAFSGCAKLAQVSLPAITSIGEKAFKNTAIETFNASTVGTLGVSAFEDCQKLTDVQFTATTPLTVIPEKAFYECVSLQTIVIPASVTTIGVSAFEECSGATKAVFTQNGALKEIGSMAFYGCSGLKEIDLPDGLEGIGGGAFACCENVRMLSIPASVQSISNNALEYCYRLYEIENLSDISITAGDGLGENTLRVYTSEEEERMARRTVGDFEFAYPVDEWYLIEYEGAGGKVSLPDAVEGETYNIVSYLFMDNESITELTVSNGATWIGKYAFADSSIRALYFSSGENELILSYGAFNDNAFETVAFGERDMQTLTAGLFSGSQTLKNVTLSSKTLYIESAAFEDCEKLASLTLPNGVERIGDTAFKNCTALKGVAIPASAVEIGASAFEGCTALVTVSVGGGVDTLGQRAFYGCTGLTAIVLPDSLTEIDSETFATCSSLKNVTFGNGLFSIGSYAFFECSALETITLPASLSYIDTGAFSGCKKLHEVYDLSASLDIEANTADHGEVAYNALVVHTSYNATSLQTATVDGFVFKYTRNNAVRAIVDYTGNALHIQLTNKTVNGSSSSYLIARYAFESDNGSIKKISIGTSVSEMRSEAFSGLSLTEIRVLAGVTMTYGGAFCNCYSESLVLSDGAGAVYGQAFNGAWFNRIYFEGDRSDWNNNYGKWNTLSCGEIFYYDTCAHDYGEWNYDSSNNVQTPMKSYQSRVVKDATCRSNGTRQYYCNDCGEQYTEIIYAYGHTYSDSECTRCGYIDHLHATKSSLSHVKQIFTISNTSSPAFSVFSSYDTIVSNNKTANSSATLTFTAKEDVVVSFNAQVYGTTGTLSVKCGTSAARTVTSGKAQSLEYTVRTGQTLTFTYTQTTADENGYAQINTMYITSLNEPN